MPVIPEINDKITVKHIDLMRLAVGERIKALALLEKMRKELIAKIATEDLTVFGKRRASQLLSEANEVIDDYYSQINAKISKTLDGLATHETEATTKIMVDAGLDAALPSQATMSAIVSDVLIMGAPSKDWWAKQSESTQFAFAQQVRQGMAQGETSQSIISRVMGIMDVRRRDAASLVHSSIMTVANDARLAVFKANDDINKGVKQISTLDGNTSDVCIAYSGAEWDLDGNPINGNDLPFDGGCPRHFNAIAQGELVNTKTGYKAIEHIYVGELVLTHRGRFKPVTAVMSKANDTGFIRVVTLESGRVIRATDEHPILTSGRGWIRADMLNIGDELFQHHKKPVPINIRLGVTKRQPDYYPSAFDAVEVFDKVSVNPGSMSIPINFNNDFFFNKSEIPNATAFNILAFISRNIQSIKVINKRLFAFCNVVKLKSLAIFKYPVHCSNGVSRVIFSHSFRMPFMYFTRFFRHTISPMDSSSWAFNNGATCPLSLSSGSYAVPLTPLLNNGFPDTQFTFDKPKRLTKRVMLFVDKFIKRIPVPKINHFNTCKIKDISIVAYNRDVFNLAVQDDETFLINDVIVHNCRSVLVPITKTFRELGLDIDEIKEGTRASDEGQIKASTTFTEFLSGKSKEYQDDLLGKGRADLWRDGKITLRDLLDQRGRPLTLAELKEKHGQLISFK